MVAATGEGMALPASAEEKMAQFQQMMNLIIGRALEVNNEKLSQDISCLVKRAAGRRTGAAFKRIPIRKKRNGSHAG